MLIAAAALALPVGPMALAQNATTRPAAAALTAADAAKVVVESVTGVASKRLASDPNGKWERIKAGDALDALTIIRTGLGTKVVLRFGSRGRVTVGAATKIGIREYLTKGALMKAQLGLKYGSVRAKVDGAAGDNDFRVATPVATLSIRGTAGGAHFGGATGLSMQGSAGIWNVAVNSRSRNVRPGESTNSALTRSLILAMLRGDVRMGDPFGGLSRMEVMNLIRNGRGRGLFGLGGGGRLNMWLYGCEEDSSNGQIIPQEPPDDPYPYPGPGDEYPGGNGDGHSGNGDTPR